jgi:hypothetical protein
MTKSVYKVRLPGHVGVFDFDNRTNLISIPEDFAVPEIRSGLLPHIAERHVNVIKRIKASGKVSVSGFTNLLMQPNGEGLDGYSLFEAVATKRSLRDSPRIYKKRQTRRKGIITYLPTWEMVKKNNDDLESQFTLSYNTIVGNKSSSYNSGVNLTYECRPCKLAGKTNGTTKGNGVITPYLFQFKELVCPTCFPSKRSKPEQAIYDYFESHSNYRIIYWTKTKSKMLYLSDLIVENLTTGQITVIEYDGSHWHRDKMEWDAEKTNTILRENKTFKALRLRAGTLVSLRRQCRSKRYYEANVNEELIKSNAEAILADLIQKHEI